MLIRSLIFIVSILHSFPLYAALKPLDLELGKATVKDIKQKYEIKDDYPSFGGTMYELDISTVHDNQSTGTAVWCDSKGIVQGVRLFKSKRVLNSVMKLLSSQYELINSISVDDVTLNLIVRFKDRDSDSFIHVVVGDLVLTEYYMTPIYRKILLEQKIIKEPK